MLFTEFGENFTQRLLDFGDNPDHIPLGLRLLYGLRVTPVFQRHTRVTVRS